MSPGQIGHEAGIDVAPGGRDHGRENRGHRHLAGSRGLGRARGGRRWLQAADSFEEMLGQHVLAWSHLWARFAIELRGCEDSQVLPVLRLHIFHLLQTISPNSMDRDVGVPARGLHGEAYRGHVFWDDLFVFPAINLRLPELGQSLMAYRYHRLPAARRAAREAGHVGAMYPWQSGSDGSEQSALLHLNPKSGRWLPDTTYLQRHVGHRGRLRRVALLPGHR